MCVVPSGSLYFIAMLPSPPGGTLNEPDTVVSKTAVPASAVKETSHFWTPAALRTTWLVANGVPGHHVDACADRGGPWAIAAPVPVMKITPARSATPMAAPA